jgi:hypothetical protein
MPPSQPSAQTTPSTAPVSHHLKAGQYITWLQNTQDLHDAAKSGDIEAVRALIPLGDPKAHNSIPLLAAAREGHLEIVRMLIPVSDPKADDSAALRWAARKGHLEIVRALIPVSDPRVQHSKPLEEAARAGHLSIVRELIPFSDPKADDSAALCWAAENDHLLTVRELIPVSNPRAKDSEPLRRAARGGHHRVARELAPVSDAFQVFREEVDRVRLGIDELDKASSVHRAFIGLSVAAVDALTPHVGEAERDQALTELLSRAIDRMPQLKAWRESQRLKVQLHQAAPTCATPRRPRLSL